MNARQAAKHYKKKYIELKNLTIPNQKIYLSQTTYKPITLTTIQLEHNNKLESDPNYIHKMKQLLFYELEKYIDIDINPTYIPEYNMTEYRATMRTFI